ncbi:MAG TPA: hypothetical protein PLC76_07900 [Saprospiraceae bacterium]|jgi:hypothetical protein|nr:hypothetical protein [Saprospiraceae bacterium]HRP84632.1 hypothetical protein [Saprospiraceae bacterium]
MHKHRNQSATKVYNIEDNVENFMGISQKAKNNSFRRKPIFFENSYIILSYPIQSIANAILSWPLAGEVSMRSISG